ncbi:MAG: zinc metallopeptidase [Candidatus Bipolaricaulota bacterium]
MISRFLIPALSIAGLVFFVAFVVEFLFQSAYQKLSQIEISSGVTAREALEALLAESPAERPSIRKTSSPLDDRYEGTQGLIYLHRPEGTSLADVGAASHEGIHFLQDQRSRLLYPLYRILYPAARLSAPLAVLLLIFGFLFNSAATLVGAVMLAFLILYILLRVPLEFFASWEAISSLEQRDLISSRERHQLRRFLSLAALCHLTSIVTRGLKSAHVLLYHRNEDGNH